MLLKDGPTFDRNVDGDEGEEIVWAEWRTCELCPGNDKPSLLFPAYGTWQVAVGDEAIKVGWGQVVQTLNVTPGGVYLLW